MVSESQLEHFVCDCFCWELAIFPTKKTSLEQFTKTQTTSQQRRLFQHRLKLQNICVFKDNKILFITHQNESSWIKDKVYLKMILWKRMIIKILTWNGYCTHSLKPLNSHCKHFTLEKLSISPTSFGLEHDSIGIGLHLNCKHTHILSQHFEITQLVESALDNVELGHEKVILAKDFKTHKQIKPAGDWNKPNNLFWAKSESMFPLNIFVDNIIRSWALWCCANIKSLQKIVGRFLCFRFLFLFHKKVVVA